MSDELDESGQPIDPLDRQDDDAYNNFVEGEMIADLREIDRLKHEIEGWKNKWECAVELVARAESDCMSLFNLVADIREALGDNGRRMQGELVEYCRKLATLKKYHDLVDQRKREYVGRWHHHGLENYDFSQPMIFPPLNQPKA